MEGKEEIFNLELKLSNNLTFLPLNCSASQMLKKAFVQENNRRNNRNSEEWKLFSTLSNFNGKGVMQEQEL